jgi:hypothetical protein
MTAWRMTTATASTSQSHVLPCLRGGLRLFGSSRTDGGQTSNM